MGATRRPSTGETISDVAFIEKDHPIDAKSFWVEVRLFLELAIPTCLLSCGFTLSPLLTASYVGLKFGPMFLSAFTLGNLTSNLCTFSLLAGVFSASDTLAPQAFGIGDYNEVGLIAARGIFASLILVIPINIFLVVYLEDLLVAAGQDPEAAFHASEWYSIFVWAVPFFVIYDAVWKFLSAQHVMRPLIYVSLFSCAVILPLGLEFFTDRFDFLGSAMAYVFFQACQCILLLLYLWVFKPHHEGTWGGLGCWREALKTKPMMEYLSLGAGGILSQSEWIYWEALGLMVGSLGVEALAAHTIPNQVIMIVCQFPFAFGTALSIRMGHVLSQSVHHAKHIVGGTIVFSFLAFAILSLGVHFGSGMICSIFTSNEEVITLAKSVWWKVTLFNLNISMFALLWGVATGLGMQWTLAAINLVFLWAIGIPVTYYLALVQKGGLAMVWTLINAPYLCMNISLIILFFLSDWGKVQAKIRQRDEMEAASELEAHTTKTSDLTLQVETQSLLATRGNGVGTVDLGKSYGSSSN